MSCVKLCLSSLPVATSVTPRRVVHGARRCGASVVSEVVKVGACLAVDRVVGRGRVRGRMTALGRVTAWPGTVNAKVLLERVQLHECNKTAQQDTASKHTALLVLNMRVRVAVCLQSPHGVPMRPCECMGGAFCLKPTGLKNTVPARFI